MRSVPAVLVLLGSLPALAFDVTTAEGRRQTILQYVASRDDLGADDKVEWDKWLRLSFGGKALKEGGSDAITAAKSVISAGIFFRLPVKSVIDAAYEAHNDVLSWVPPPVAIQYQLLKLQGRAPKEGARLMAFNFPRYYSDELAAEYVGWWAQRLAKGEVNPSMLPQVERQVKETRALMRPMMCERLYLLAELEARLDGARDPRDLRAQLQALRQELARDFEKVAQSPEVYDGKRSTYERYVALAEELGKKPRAAPARPKPTALRPTKPGGGDDERPGDTKPDADKKDKDEKKPGVDPRKEPEREGDADDEDEESAARGLRRAPLAGDPLIRVDGTYDDRVEQSVTGWLGTPYLYGGDDKQGVDCSAFVREVYRESQRVELPRTAMQQAAVGAAIAPPKLQSGDIVLFDILERGRVSHVGLFVGRGLFAHASSSRGVVRDKFDARWVQRAFRGSRRVLDPEGP